MTLPSGGADEDPRADLRWGTVPRLLADLAHRSGSREALVDRGVRLTYGGLAAEAGTMTRALVASGVDPGDRVALWGPNCAEWAVAALGVLGAGGILVPLNTRLKGAEAAHILRVSGAKLLFTVRGFLGLDYPSMLRGEKLGPLGEMVLLFDRGPAGTGTEPATPLGRFCRRAGSVGAGDGEARSHGVAPEEVSDLIFTSGTTGRPKGVMASHAQSLRTFGIWASIVGLGPGDRYLIVNPFFHTFGYKAGLLACMMAGAVAVPEAVFDVDTVLRRIAEERITVLAGPPTLFRALLDHPDRAAFDLSTLRLGVTGAAVVPVELVVAMREVIGFDTVLTAYGLTEACGTATMCRRGDPPEVVAETSGRAIPGVEVRIVDDRGAEVPPGSTGEVVVRGYNVMGGYWGDPAASAAAIDPGGWLHTGDLGRLDPAGNLTITDRLKDMFVTGGFNAYPAEIEAILAGCPEVRQVAVIGVPDDRLGEVGCAYLVPDSSVRPATGQPGGPGDRTSERELAFRVLLWSRQEMANFKAPRYAVVVDELPLNAAGKVLKGVLRERFAASRAGDPDRTPDDIVELHNPASEGSK